VSRAIGEVALPQLPLFRRGKVRDTYDLGDRLLMVASDRISAFDVVLPDLIPGKGRVLTGLSTYWFGLTRHIIPNHLLSASEADLPPAIRGHGEELAERFMLVRRAERIDIECVVRGYLAGSAWYEYRQYGTVCGEALPAGLVESQQLDVPIFTPAIKADAGHDENISFERAAELVDTDVAQRLREVSIELYRFGAQRARAGGIIVADTKFEFGWVDGRLTLIDELLTPDSSRLWDSEHYAPGRAQESFDKQPVRDWLVAAAGTSPPRLRTYRMRCGAPRPGVTKKRDGASSERMPKQRDGEHVRR